MSPDAADFARMRATAGLEQAMASLGDAERVIKMRVDRLIEEGWRPETAERIGAEFLIDLQRLLLMSSVQGR